MQAINQKILPLFPSIIFISKIEDKNFLKQLTQRLLSLKSKGRGNGNSIGWWSEDNLHEMEEFSDITKIFMEESEKVLDFHEVIRDSHYLTTMWVNIANHPSYSHQAHIHPNSLFSGVFHLSIPDNASSTSFSDPRPGARMIEPSYARMTQYNAGVSSPPAEEGQLIIFPSYLPHAVHYSPDISFKGKKNRITMSFNVMIRGKISTRTAKLELR